MSTKSSRENLGVLVQSMRLPKNAGQEAEISASERELIFQSACQGRELLSRHFTPGLGVVPSGNPDENYYNQLWARDAAHYMGNMPENSLATQTSLVKLFEHQKENGMLPLRVEKEYMMIKLVPGLRRLAKPLFNFIEGKLRRRKERPVYEGQDFSGAEDTVPVTVIAVGEFFLSGNDQAKEFFVTHYEQIFKAVEFFSGKTDPRDGLAETGELSPDWEDSINRRGKLGGINVYWARALRLMEFMSRQIGKTEEADVYKEMAAKVRKSIREKLYSKQTRCIRAAVDDDRVDTVASIYAGLYLLTPSETEVMEKSFLDKVVSLSGFLLNHDIPYPGDQKQTAHKLIGHTGYHDKYVWPWVTGQNIQVKIKIALHHPERIIREKNKQAAVSDLLMMANNFRENNGAYEILRPDTGKPAITRGYIPPKEFMANWATYLSAYKQMIKLGWIKL